MWRMRFGCVLALLTLACASPAKKPAAPPPGPPASEAPAASEPAQFVLPASTDEGCNRYAAAVTPFFNDLQVEYDTLQKTMNTAGADAIERFGLFLRTGAAQLNSIETDERIRPAHDRLVHGINDMGAAFLELAVAVRAQDQAAGQTAADRLQSSSTEVGLAFEELKLACAT